MSKPPVVDCLLIYQKIQKGISSARSDNTKSLKAVVVDWITPQDKPLNPPLSWSITTTHGFHHPATGTLLCPAGLDWQNQELLCIHLYLFSPLLSCQHRICAKLASSEMAVQGNQWLLLVYDNQEFNFEAPQDGLFQSELLVWVHSHLSLSFFFIQLLHAGL